MCVIIHRKPGITIPFEKLQSACIVNKDGMGLVAFDRGKLELRKFFEDGGNNPDTLQKFLDDAKDLHVYAHLRYRTRGATDKSNVHPFGVLTKKKHGTDLQFMHNGTLSDFGTATECDSKQFAKKLLRPLTEKFLASMDAGEIIHDDTYITILEKYAGKSSVFLLVDSEGGHRIINYSEGHEFDGWWASNKYSFDRTHREPTWTHGTTRWKNDGEWTWDSKTQNWEPKRSSPQVSLAPVPKPAGDTKPVFNDEVPFSTEGTTKTPEVSKKIVNPTLPKRERFIDVAEITDLSCVTQLSFEHIQTLVDEHPDEAALLIRDLIKELWDRDMENDDTVSEAA